MSDLISRQAAIEAVHKSIYDFFDICDDDEESPMTYKDELLLEINKAITTRIKAVASTQPIEAEPVKHGRWVDMGDFEQCSVCQGTHLKEFATYYGNALWVKTPYCHNCGAIMDKED